MRIKLLFLLICFAASTAGAAPAVVKAMPAGEREFAVQLQIFLDEAHFGPGKIDGRAKEFTLKALGRYLRAHGMRSTGTLADAAKLPLESVSPIYTTHTITEEDLRFVGPVPGKPSEQAKLKRLPYPSLLIYVAERYHSDPDFLAKINPGKNLYALQPGDTLFVPNVKPFKIEEITQAGRLPQVPEFKNRQIQICTKEKMLELLENGKLLAAFPITPGSEANPAPAGTWKIVAIHMLPWFRWDDGMLKHGVRTENFHNLPAGPSSPVGVVWCALNKTGIGVHGTNKPFTIGRAGSHGCIRLANWDAVRLAGMVTEGMVVTIGPEPPAKDSLTSAADPATKNTP